jgi:hypothetical protein
MNSGKLSQFMTNQGQDNYSLHWRVWCDLSPIQQKLPNQQLGAQLSFKAFKCYLEITKDETGANILQVKREPLFLLPLKFLEPPFLRSTHSWV